MFDISTSFAALLWGALAGSALLLGAVVGFYVRLSQRLIAGIMAFGSGVLIAVLAFDLMNEAVEKGGFGSAAIGFVAGAVIYTIANEILSIFGGRHRKRSNQKTAENKGSGTSIAVGALIDGIPESMAIGLSLLSGSGVSLAVVIGIFLSNIPEGLSSAAGMKSTGKSATYVFTMWVIIMLLSGLASWFGYVVMGNFDTRLMAATQALAAGGILAMIVDTMIPEAFSKTHQAAGLITTLGFLAAFLLHYGV